MTEHDRDWIEFFIGASNEMAVPDDIRRAAKAIIDTYGLCGICDPVCIANMIAIEMGRGDGNNNFWTK